MAPAEIDAAAGAPATTTNTIITTTAVDGAPSNRATSDQVSASGSSSSSGDSIHKRKRRNRNRNRNRNGKNPATSDNMTVALNGRHSAFENRRSSLSKAARDPRDEPVAKKNALRPNQPPPRAPSPVIDYDGLSRPSKSLFPPLSSSLSPNGGET